MRSWFSIRKASLALVFSGSVIIGYIGARQVIPLSSVAAKYEIATPAGTVPSTLTDSARQSPIVDYSDLLLHVDLLSPAATRSRLKDVLAGLPIEKVSAFLSEAVSRIDGGPSGYYGKHGFLARELVGDLVTKLDEAAPAQIEEEFKEIAASPLMQQWFAEALFASNPHACLSLLGTWDNPETDLILQGIRETINGETNELYRASILDFLNDGPALEPRLVDELRKLSYLAAPDQLGRMLAEADLAVDSDFVMSTMRAYALAGGEQLPRFLKEIMPRLSSEQHNTLALTVGSPWFRKEPEAAASWIAQQSLEVQKTAMAAVFRNLMGQGRFMEAMPLIDRFDGVGASPEVRAKIAEELSFWKGSDAGFSWLKNSSWTNERDLRWFAESMIGRDPLWVMEHEADFPSLDGPSAAELTTNLVSIDPDQAIRWAGAIADPSARETTLARALGTIAQGSPSDAVEYFNALPADQQTTPVLRSIVREVANIDWRLAEEFASANAATIEEKVDLRRAALSSGLSEGDPEAIAAMETLLNENADMPAAQSAARSFVENQFWRDRDGLQEVIKALPPGKVQEKAIDTLVARWAPLDPVGAAEMLASFDHISDQAISSLVPQIRNDLEGALAWTSQMKDRNQQPALLEELVAQWWQIDPEYTRRALHDSPLDRNVAQEIIEAIPKR